METRVRTAQLRRNKLHQRPPTGLAGSQHPLWETNILRALHIENRVRLSTRAHRIF
jgi:hypothetical protein